jgi:hypothetical protein
LLTIAGKRSGKSRRIVTCLVCRIFHNLPYANAHGKWTWHWWLFVAAIIPCIVVGQFRAGMIAELRGKTSYALARPIQLLFWSVFFGVFYAAMLTAVAGLLF